MTRAARPGGGSAGPVAMYAAPVQARYFKAFHTKMSKKKHRKHKKKSRKEDTGAGSSGSESDSVTESRTKVDGQKQLKKRSLHSRSKHRKVHKKDVRDLEESTNQASITKMKRWKHSGGDRHGEGLHKTSSTRMKSKHREDSGSSGDGDTGTAKKHRKGK